MTGCDGGHGGREFEGTTEFDVGIVAVESTPAGGQAWVFEEDRVGGTWSPVGDRSSPRRGAISSVRFVPSLQLRSVRVEKSKCS